MSAKAIALRIGSYRFAIRGEDWPQIRQIVTQAMAHPGRPVRRNGAVGMLGAIAFQTEDEIDKRAKNSEQI